jgi:hypothetical protein
VLSGVRGALAVQQAPEGSTPGTEGAEELIMESFEVGQRVRIVNPQYLQGNGLSGPVEGIVMALDEHGPYYAKGHASISLLNDYKKRRFVAYPSECELVEPKRKNRIIVPEGMFTAFIGAENHDGPKWDDRVLYKMLKAALLWLSENPIVPTLEQAEYMYDGAKGSHSASIQYCMTEWQRRMFLAPEPWHPEEIKDMLSDGKDAASMQYNKDILEAFRRGQKSKLMVK